MIARPADRRPCAKCQRRPRATIGCIYCRRCRREVYQAWRVRTRIKGHERYSWRAMALGAAWLIAIASEVWYDPSLFWSGMLLAGVEFVIAIGAAVFAYAARRIE